MGRREARSGVDPPRPGRAAHRGARRQARGRAPRAHPGAAAPLQRPRGGPRQPFRRAALRPRRPRDDPGAGGDPAPAVDRRAPAARRPRQRPGAPRRRAVRRAAAPSPGARRRRLPGTPRGRARELLPRPGRLPPAFRGPAVEDRGRPRRTRPSRARPRSLRRDRPRGRGGGGRALSLGDAGGHGPIRRARPDPGGADHPRHHPPRRPRRLQRPRRRHPGARPPGRAGDGLRAGLLHLPLDPALPRLDLHRPLPLEARRRGLPGAASRRHRDPGGSACAAAAT